MVSLVVSPTDSGLSHQTHLQNKDLCSEPRTISSFKCYLIKKSQDYYLCDCIMCTEVLVRKPNHSYAHKNQLSKFYYSKQLFHRLPSLNIISFVSRCLSELKNKLHGRNIMEFEKLMNLCDVVVKAGEALVLSPPWIQLNKSKDLIFKYLASWPVPPPELCFFFDNQMARFVSSRWSSPSSEGEKGP